MKPQILLCCLLAAASISGGASFTLSQEAEPEGTLALPPDLPLPRIAPPSPGGKSSSQPPSRQEQQIRQALQGRDSQLPVADGLLEDVLRVIRNRGSVLDGSVLDTPATDETPATHRRPSGAAEQTNQQREKRVFTAELLLRASRHLSGLRADDAQRHALVKQMREEAKKLLSE